MATSNTQRKYRLTWDAAPAVVGTEDQIRADYESTNLFDVGSTWSCDGLPVHIDNLGEVIQEIGLGEEWTCDNCTITIVVPLCEACVSTIGGAGGEPDFPWMPAGDEPCGAADCGEYDQN